MYVCMYACMYCMYVCNGFMIEIHGFTHNLRTFLVEMTHQSPIGQAIHFVPNLAKLSAECAINGIK